MTGPSHTHGPGLVLTNFVWKEGSTEIGTGETTDLTLPVGVHEVGLTVTDSGGFTSTEVTTITVLPFGYPDVESLSPSQGSVAGGFVVTINGSGFTDASELIVHFGLADISGNDITVVDSNTIEVMAPTEVVAVPVPVSVESIPLNATSNSMPFTYVETIPIEWTSKKITTLQGVTVAKFGPDGKLYGMCSCRAYCCCNGVLLVVVVTFVLTFSYLLRSWNSWWSASQDHSE